MFCKKCGQKLDPNDRYCPQCGFRVETKTKEESKIDTENGADEFDWEDNLYELPDENEGKEESTKKQKDTIKWIISIAISTVFLFITAAVVSTMLRNASQEDYPRIVVNAQKSSVQSNTNKGQGTEEKTDEITVPTRTPTVTPSPSPSVTPTVIPKPTTAPKPTQSEIKIIREEYKVFGGTQESETNNTSTDTGDYVFPQSAVGYLSRSQLEGLTKEQLLYARNEIYARHGRKFLDETIQAYFNGKSWYSPQYEAADFDASSERVFNEYEKANIKLISDYETEKGYFY